VKVLFISSRADIGGGPKHLLDLLSSDAFSKVEKYVAIPRGHELSSAISSHSNGALFIPHRKFSFWRFILLIIFCREKGIQLIHSHGRGAGVYSRLLSIFGIPVVHTFHGIHHERTFIGNLKLNIDRLLKLLAEHYICVSEDEKEKALNYGVCSEAYVVPNGVSCTPINPYTVRKTLKVGLLARLSYQKGIDILISHLNSITLKDITFQIAGSGENELQLKESAKETEALTFLGKTLEPRSFLLDCDVFLSTSRWEGFPLSVLEAMACGIPCLLPDVTGHRLFKENGCALFYDLHSAIDFKNKLEQLKSDYELRLNLSKKGHHLIKESLNLESMANRTISVYQKVL